MDHTIDLAWKERMTFEVDIDGHVLTIDADLASGGDNRGPRPKKLMLVALAGCTGIDVISILKKMKIEPEVFNVIVEGDVADDHPKKYTEMKIIYQFKGKNLPIEKLQKAVNLSQEKYCWVSAVYRDALKLKSEIRIVE